MVKVQNWPVKDLDPGRGWIHCVYGSDHPLMRHVAIHYNWSIVFCVGGSKELAVLYESYSTATFVMQCYTDENTIS